MKKMNKKEKRSLLMKDKRGAEMTIGTLVAIILGLIVLVVIALGFTMGWQNLWEKLTGFGGSSLATVGQACQIACTGGDANAYCKQARSIKGLTLDQAALLQKNTAGATVEKYEGTSVDEVSDNNWKVTGINCAQLKEATLITLGDCTPPTCS